MILPFLIALISSWIVSYLLLEGLSLRLSYYYLLLQLVLYLRYQLIVICSPMDYKSLGLLYSVFRRKSTKHLPVALATDRRSLVQFTRKRWLVQRSWSSRNQIASSPSKVQYVQKHLPPVHYVLFIIYIANTVGMMHLQGRDVGMGTD